MSLMVCPAGRCPKDLMNCIDERFGQHQCQPAKHERQTERRCTQLQAPAHHDFHALMMSERRSQRMVLTMRVIA